jgi:hypothetical protein
MRQAGWTLDTGTFGTGRPAPPPIPSVSGDGTPVGDRNGKPRRTSNMRRRIFDTMLSTTGVVLTILLLVSGGLLYWGYSFANNTVHDQLAAQQIFFPAKGSQSLAAPEVGRT